MKSIKKNPTTAIRAFTLIEIMVVVVILGILASIIVPNIIKRPDEAKIIAARQDIMALENALELYRLDNGFYPSTDQGLQALVKQPQNDPAPTNWREGGYVKRLRTDPWGQPYQYLHPGIHSDIDLFSLAANKTEIGNWHEA